MKKSLTERWGTWLEACGHDDAVTYPMLRDVILPELKQNGFEVPGPKTLQATLTSGLGDLPKLHGISRGGRGTGGTRMCGFAHILNLLWAPLLEYLESITAEASPKWTESLAANQACILLEMSGTVPGADECLEIDKWIDLIKDTLFKLVKVHVPRGLILQVLSPLVPVSLAPTPSNALHILRSSWCSKLIGPALAAHVNRRILSDIAEVPVEMMSQELLDLQIRQNLVDMLAERHCEPDLEDRPTKRCKRQDKLSANTEQVLFILQHRVTWRRANATIKGALELAEKLTSSASSSSTTQDLEIDQVLKSRFQLAKHMLFLDGAVDRCMNDKLLTLREEGRLAGVAFATDESPPSQPRFRGLRFQITCFYVGTFLSLDTWESSAAPPILKTYALADIVHCPGKKGVDVSRILEKQLARLGLNCFDVMSGTGDGGGENEGHLGVHTYFENLNPGYVRRRCLPHISWRTCDVAIRTSGLDYKALAAYFVEGITWSRLREIATRDPAQGGLQLFSDGSQRCKAIFGQKPCAIVENRPETDLNLLKFLEGKEDLLHQLATKDLEQRSLSADTRGGILNLGDIKARIHRRVLQEILERCMFLHYWCGKHESVASSTSWDELLQKSVSLILSLEITPRVLNNFKMNEEDLAGDRPKTWVELAVLQVVGEQDLVGERMQEALEFHNSVSSAAASHLNLLGDNTFRTPWLAAKLLNKDRVIARDAAASVLRHLDTTHPSNRTSFEERLATCADLMRNLEDFANAEPPVLLWHSNGKYESLFKFLAPRFLLSPDHVLDAERIHARWQWACEQKRSLKLQSLNAMLRLSHYLENNQVFPTHEELLPNLTAETLEHKMALAALEDDGEVAMGWRYRQAPIKINLRSIKRQSSSCRCTGECICACKCICIYRYVCM